MLLDVVNHSPIAKSFSINFLSAASALTPAGFFGSRQQPPLAFLVDHRIDQSGKVTGLLVQKVGGDMWQIIIKV